MAEDKKPEDNQPEDPTVYDTITKDIVHKFPEGLSVTFSDNIAVQHTPSEFTITFAQIQHPIVAKSSDYDAIEAITANVVARIVLTPVKMLEFMQSLQENWGIYQKRMKALRVAQNAAATETADSN